MIVANPVVFEALAALFFGVLLLGLLFFGRALVRRGVRRDTLVNIGLWLLLALMALTLALGASLRMRNRAADEGPGRGEIVEGAAPRDQ